MYKVTLDFNTAEEALAFFTKQVAVQHVTGPQVCCLGTDDGRELFTTPVNPAPAPAPAPAPLPIDIVMDMLNDERFTLRTVSSVVGKAGLMNDAALYDLLNKFGIDYITMRKQRTHEQLVGLRTRN